MTSSVTNCTYLRHVICTLAGATTTDIFLSEHGNDDAECSEPQTACRTLRRAMQVADGQLTVVYIDAAPRSTSSWLCREETVQVGCATSNDGNRN